MDLVLKSAMRASHKTFTFSYLSGNLLSVLAHAPELLVSLAAVKPFLIPTGSCLHCLSDRFRPMILLNV
jgi:hypothetical protein